MRASRRVLAGAVASWIAIAASSLAGAQVVPTPAVPDQVIQISTTLGVDNPLSSFYPGSIFQTVRQGNVAVAAPGVDYVSLTVQPAMSNLSLVLVDPIPVIDLSTLTSAEPRIDISSTLAPAFIVRTAPTVPANFVLLHVKSGRADLVDLNISSGRLDALGIRVPLTMIVDQNAKLGFRYSRDFVLDENITGAGAVRIENDREKVVTFSGSNDYTGGTHVVKGTLRGNTVSLPGDFLVDKDAVLDLRITQTTLIPVFAGDISGEGKLLKSGIGTVLLSGGTATHTGGTDVTAGRLLTDPLSLTGNVAVSQGAQFWLRPVAAAPFAGVISGAGSLRKSGNSDLILTGANTFTGGLFVQNGDVIGTTATIPGNVTLEAVTPPDAPARVFFDQDFDGTHIGTVSGTGSLIKDGTGRVLRQGITSSNLTQVLGGTLAGDVPALGNTIEVVNRGSTAEFSLASSQTFAGTLSGLGDVSKTGAGTLVLGTNLLHFGQTTVGGGTLQLQANLVNSTLLRVDPGARLANVSGAAPAADLQNQGRVGLGGSTTDFTVASAILSAGSTLEVNLDDAGNASRLVVTGTADLNAPLYELYIASGDYSVSTQYTVISAGAISPASTAGTTVDDLPFITVTSPPTIVGGNAVVFSIQEDFSNIAAYGTTPNQVATGAALEQVTNSGSADARAIRNGLVPLRTSQVPPVLDMMAGETLSAFTNSRVANTRNFADTILRRVRTNNWELTRPPTVPATGPVEPAAVGAPRSSGQAGAWLVPFGLFGNNDGNGNASDMDTNTYGVSGGLDYRLPLGLRLPDSQNYRVGVALGYTHHSLENSTGFMQGTGNTAQTALYGGYRSEHFHTSVAGNFAWTRMQTDRTMVFTDVYRDAVASFEGLEWGALTEVGGHFGQPKRALLHPIARFQYIHTSQDAFQETGAGDLDLSVPALDYDSLLLTLGARVSRVFTLKGEFGIEPELRGGWTIDFGDLDRSVPATFYVVPGAVPFVTTGAQPDKNSGTIGIGYVMTVGDVPLLSTHYDFEFGESFTRQVITAGLYFRW